MTTTTDRARPGQAESDPGRLTLRLRLTPAVVLLADVLDLMDSTITNIAAPTVDGGHRRR